VDSGIFYELIASMNGGLAEGLLALDKGLNNTSVVIELAWRGRRLLFTGDAEQESWQLMAENAGLAPVDLLKVAHHGSVTGRPPAPALDAVLPKRRRRSAQAVISTHVTTQWPGVPSPDAIAELQARTRRLYRTDQDVEPGSLVTVTVNPLRKRK
jgi:beta-lactamase superfamily II metal-dependent hydrolase